MATKKIAIVTPHSITNIGLKQILFEYFDQKEIQPFLSVSELMSCQPESFDLYFIFPELMLVNYDFFLPRRSKTVLISQNKALNHSFPTLHLEADLSTTIEQIETIVNRLKSAKLEEIQAELSLREVEVLRLIARGKINKEIADELCISLNTVLTHRKNITAKLGIKTVSGLTFYAMMNGFIAE